MKNKYLLAFVSATALVLGATLTMAQDQGELPPPPPPHGEMHMPAPDHARPMPPNKDLRMPGMSERMAEDLGLSEEQKAEAKKIQEQGREKIKPLFDEMRGVREKMDKVREENMKEFEKILTPEQQKKFSDMKDRMKHHRRDRMHRRGGMPKPAADK